MRAWITAALAAGTIGTLASAQEQVPGSDSPALEEVLVTSQRREERLQDVPVAITAVTSEVLTAARVTDLYTLAATTPWVNMTQDSAISQQLNIRGIVSVKLNDATAEPSVGLFVDEVYVSRMGSAFTDFYDLDRIEVIRGPQGVLLGKNVVGGALSVVTAKPSQVTSGAATVSYGNFDSFLANGYLTGGLTDSISGRAAFQVRNRSGYNRNVLLGRELDDLESYQGRVHFAYERPDGDLSALLSFEYGRDESNGTIRAALDDEAIPGMGTLGAYRAANGLDPREDMSPQEEYVERRSFAASLRLDWEGFDWGTLTSITAYRDSDSKWSYNQIGFGNPPSIVDTFIITEETPKTFSQELRLVSDSTGPWDWLAGAYYQHDDINRPYRHIASTNAAIPVFSGDSLYDVSATIESSAVFGQVGYRFNDAWKLTGGLRYLNDRKSGRKDVTCLDDGGDGACVTPLRGPTGTHWIADYGKTWDATTGQLILEYRPTQTAMLYASVASGFKGGGWDFIPPTPEAAQIYYNPEEVVSYELGLKSEFLANRLRVNIAAFQMDYEDLQAQRTDLDCLCLITSNAGSARVRGVEFELTAAVTEGLTFNGAFTSLDPKYLDYDDQAGHVYDGKTMQRTPKFKYNVGLLYSADFGDWQDALLARVNYTHQSEIFWAPDNVSRQAPYGLLDASIRLQSRNGQWAVSLWGKNLTDELYAQLGLPFLGDLVQVWGPPRTYGVDLNYSF